MTSSGVAVGHGHAMVRAPSYSSYPSYASYNPVRRPTRPTNCDFAAQANAKKRRKVFLPAQSKRRQSDFQTFGPSTFDESYLAAQSLNRSKCDRMAARREAADSGERIPSRSRASMRRSWSS